MQAGYDITVVTVIHDSGAVLEAFLKALPAGIPLVVVDNASSDDGPEILRRLRPDAEYLHNAVGQGYGGGATRGLEAVRTGYALLANPDSLVDEAPLAILQAATATFPDGAVYGPLIVNADGSPELSYDVEVFRRRELERGAALQVPVGPLCADFLSGAVMLVRMSAMREIGYFDPNIFLYYEDDDLCMRLRRAGHSLILVPEARVPHVGGGSVRPSRQYYWEKYWHIAWSRLYLEGKWHGLSPARRLALRQLARFALKAAGYALVFQGFKARRDAARCAGSLGFLLGRGARPGATGTGL